MPAPGAILEHIWKLRASEMATFDLNRPEACGKEILLAARRLHPVDGPANEWMAEFDERFVA